MNLSDLPAFQEPIKERYRSHPRDAFVTLRAEGKLSSELACNVRIGRNVVEAGLHPSLGGAEGTVCPADLFLSSIVACFGVTLRAVAAHMGITIKQGVVRAEGELDVRGTLGVSKDVPVGFQRLRVNVELETEAPDEQLRTLMAVAEKYAVVIQTQAASPQLSTTCRRK